MRRRTLLLALSLAMPVGHATQWPAYPPPKTIAEVDAWSARIKLRPSYGKCLDNAAGTTSMVLDCASVEHAYQDKRLNAVYKQLTASLDAEDKRELKAEERQWIVYRDQTCNAENQPETAPEGCQVETTADRATELEARLNTIN